MTSIWGQDAWVSTCQTTRPDIAVDSNPDIPTQLDLKEQIVLIKSGDEGFIRLRNVTIVG
jgi:hypothetical protein